MDAASERKLLGLLGLGLRARTALVGVEQVRNAARRGKLVLAVVAPDASQNSRDKVIPLLKAKRVRVIGWPYVAALGAAVGRNATAAIGIVDRDLARGIREITDQGPAVAQQEGRF